MDFGEAAGYLESLDQIGTAWHSREYHFENGIARARHLLARLGGSGRTRCVIITGSKGKGSTVSMLASIVASAGYRVGAFTGPHLHSPVERFAVLDGRGANGAPYAFSNITEDAFCSFVAAIRQIVNDWDSDDIGLPTRFEAYTAMACCWFERMDVDLAVMEVGIGGRLDAVNMVEPMLSVFTNISLEHTQMLGNTIAEIAREKGGIMRADGHAVFARQSDEGARALMEHARRVGTSFEFAEDRWHCEAVRHALAPGQRGQWFMAGDGEQYFTPLLGTFQLQNAACAIASAHALAERGFNINREAIRSGLAVVRWQGRFDILAFDPLVIADGAHTPYSMEQLAQSLREYVRGRRLHFVIGVLRDKDARGIVRAIMPVAHAITCTQAHYRRAIPAQTLLEMANEAAREAGIAVGPSLCASHNVGDALSFVMTNAARDDVVCICGSLHVVAEAQVWFASRNRVQ